MKGKFEKRMETTWKNIENLEAELLSRGDQRTYQGLQWAKKAISDIMHNIDDARKALLVCKDYESLRNEVLRWLGDE